MEYRFEIPGKPVGKARPRVYGKHAMTPESTVLYENLVKMMALQAMAGGRQLSGCLSLEVAILHAIPKSTPKSKVRDFVTGAVRPRSKPDADNVVKIIADALNGVMYHDDAAIVEIIARKYYYGEPHVRVTVLEVPG